MKTVAIIQARMGSTRLPGKVLAKACGKPLLVHMIERLERCETLNEICVAIAEGPENGPIVDAVVDMITEREYDECRIGWTWGSETDVLGRVLRAARLTKADLIVELTADCPLIDPEVVDLTVREFMRWWDNPDLPSMDFVTNVISPIPYPRGMDVRVFPTAILEEVDQLGKTPADREHVSLYIWEHAADFYIKYIHPPTEHLSDARLTVDTEEDLRLVQKIFKFFCSPSAEEERRQIGLVGTRPDFDLGDILTLLKARPDLAAINAHVQQKAVR